MNRCTLQRYVEVNSNIVTVRSVNTSVNDLEFVVNKIYNRLKISTLSINFSRLSNLLGRFFYLVELINFAK